jgi:hypothetical protein
MDCRPGLKKLSPFFQPIAFSMGVEDYSRILKELSNKQLVVLDHFLLILCSKQVHGSWTGSPRVLYKNFFGIFG